MANPNLTKGNNYFRNEQYKEAIEACSKIDKSIARPQEIGTISTFNSFIFYIIRSVFS